MSCSLTAEDNLAGGGSGGTAASAGDAGATGGADSGKDANGDGSGSCPTGFDDCDGDGKNGCETNVAQDPSNCGACSKQCASGGGSATCTAGVCGTSNCPAPTADCNGTPASCETNLQTSVQNCGFCGNACSPLNATGTCVAGQCGMGACSSGFGDCDSNPATGCEASLSTLTDCGSCGSVCAIANATASCSTGTCQFAQCSAGFDNCDSVANNGCETNVQQDPKNCGTCGNACPASGGTPICNAGVCGVSSCTAPNGDCDGNASTCETNLHTSLQNCGFCGNACNASNATPTCTTGTCGIGACTSGFGNCDSNASNGCETALSSLSNCGTCGKTCSFPNANASCATGTCVFSSCVTGFGNCDNNTSNGCEAALNLPTKCGSCTTSCPTLLNSTPTCNGTTCGFACNSGFGDCTSSPGCETNTNTTVSRCGSCSTNCNSTAPPYTTPTCVGGACQFECQYGRADCTAAPGCETDVLNNSANCGACGHDCLGGSCSSGMCPTTIIAQYQDRIQSLAVDGGHVYFSCQGSCDGVKKAPKVPGGVTTIESTSSARGLGVDASNTFWAQSGGIMRDTLTSGAIATPLTGVSSPYGVALDATHVYFTAGSSSGSVQRIGKSGAGLDVILANQSTPRGIAVDDTYVFWANQGGTIWSAEKGTLTSKSLATAQSSPEGIAADGTNVYWTNHASIGSVMACKRDGSAAPFSISSIEQSPHGIAVDANYVYWTSTNASQGYVKRAPKTGAGPTLIIAQVPNSSQDPLPLAIDPNYAYFAAGGSGSPSIYQVAK